MRLLAISLLPCLLLLSGCNETQPAAIPTPTRSVPFDDYTEIETPPVGVVIDTPFEYMLPLDEQPSPLLEPLPPNDRRIVEQAIVAHEQKLAVHLDNLANAETFAFKRNMVGLTDRVATNDSGGSGVPKGLGSTLGIITRDCRQGALSMTGRPLDVAIEGSGYLQVNTPDGEIWISRVGRFRIDVNCNLVLTHAGIDHSIEPPICIPSDTTSVQITTDGRVRVRIGNAMQLIDVGQIQLAAVVNQQGLRREGGGFYSLTDRSGVPEIATPGNGVMGILRQGVLEMSNVEPDEEIRQINRCRKMLVRLRALVGDDQHTEH